MQRSLFPDEPPKPKFDGADYDHARDHVRLGEQYQRIWDVMAHGEWLTLEEISIVTGDPPASISAQLRHMRKKKFGGHTVEKEYVANGLYRYKLIPNTKAT